MSIHSYNGWCPRGTALANGQIMPINRNQALFALVGTIHGGDGRATFALPKANTTTPEGLQGIGLAPGLYYCVAVQGIFPSRDWAPAGPDNLAAVRPAAERRAPERAPAACAAG